MPIQSEGTCLYIYVDIYIKKNQLNKTCCFSTSNDTKQTYENVIKCFQFDLWSPYSQQVPV